ncbi:hypothetical protein [Salipaludibacillus agaradhaerens]|jgi:hypothetical protein|uniref:hypothetical protein n=1 Tax=Salipaludibacillus agaradhaerens TaxID=76935 RepID=UPI002151F360|nr:hypothetical protein [Salipaludibacillus agaradhaerens]
MQHYNRFMDKYKRITYFLLIIIVAVLFISVWVAIDFHTACIAAMFAIVFTIHFVHPAITNITTDIWIKRYLVSELQNPKVNTTENILFTLDDDKNIANVTYIKDQTAIDVKAKVLYSLESNDTPRLSYATYRREEMNNPLDTAMKSLILRCDDMSNGIYFPKPVLHLPKDYFRKKTDQRR